MAKEPKVFLSYAREDKEQAKKLYEELTKMKIQVWTDFACLRPGDRWKPAIERAIKENDYFIALLSSRSISKRGFVQKEISRALDVLDEFPKNEVFVIPARLDECVPSHETLKDLHWVDLFPSWSEGVKRIALAITQNELDFEIAEEANVEDVVANVNIQIQGSKQEYVSVTVILVTSGKAFDMRIPVDMMVDHAIPELVGQLGLPKSFIDGQPVSYRLVSKTQGQTLDGNLTFRQNNVTEGEELGLNVDFVAG